MESRANGYGNGLNPNPNMWQYFTKFKMLSAHAIMGVKSVGKKDRESAASGSIWKMLCLPSSIIIITALISRPTSELVRWGILLHTNEVKFLLPPTDHSRNMAIKLSRRALFCQFAILFLLEIRSPCLNNHHGFHIPASKGSCMKYGEIMPNFVGALLQKKTPQQWIRETTLFSTPLPMTCL